MSNDVNMPIELRKQRDFSEVISTGFQFIRQNWKSLYRPLVFICLPLYVVASLLFGSFFRTMMMNARGGGNPAAILSSMGSMMVGYAVMAVAVMMLYALVFEYLRFYMLNNGLTPTTGELWRETRKNLLMYIALAIVLGMMIGVGLVLCILPGIYLAVVFVMAFPLYAFERASIGDCISRSFKVIKGNWWLTFALVLVLSMLIGFISYIIYLPFILLTGFGAMSGLHGMNDPSEMGERMGWMMSIFMVVAGVVNVLLQPFLQVPIALHALSLMEQKEGQGLMQQVDNINLTPLP